MPNFVLGCDDGETPYCLRAASESVTVKTPSKSNFTLLTKQMDYDFFRREMAPVPLSSQWSIKNDLPMITIKNLSCRSGFSRLMVQQSRHSPVRGKPSKSPLAIHCLVLTPD